MSNAGEIAVGVVGLGFGANHARVLSQLENVRLAAVCDTDQERLTAVTAGRKIGAYTDYRRMLAKEPLDALIVAVPARLHAEVALASIEADVAVLVEKPLAPSLAEALVITEAAAKAGVPLMPGHIERFNPAVQELARRVQSGEIGRVLQLMARRMGPIVLRMTQDVNIVHDSALHDVDVMRYVLGAEVEHVYAEAQVGVVMPFEDSIAGLLRFAPTNGTPRAIGSLEVNWLAHRTLRELVVLGESGQLVLDYVGQTLDLYRGAPTSQRPRGWETWSLASAPGPRPVTQIRVEPREPLAAELTAFIAALRQGTPMPVRSEDGLAALAIADALTESARTGRPVTPVRE